MVTHRINYPVIHIKGWILRSQRLAQLHSKTVVHRGIDSSFTGGHLQQPRMCHHWQPLLLVLTTPAVLFSELLQYEHTIYIYTYVNWHNNTLFKRLEEEKMVSFLITKPFECRKVQGLISRCPFYQNYAQKATQLTWKTTYNRKNNLPIEFYRTSNLIIFPGPLPSSKKNDDPKTFT